MSYQSYEEWLVTQVTPTFDQVLTMMNSLGFEVSYSHIRYPTTYTERFLDLEKAADHFGDYTLDATTEIIK